MAITLALAGDTMLGRKVAEAIDEGAPPPLVAPEVAEIARSADLFVLNLECCISERGTRWPAPGKPFFFRAPPVAAQLLTELGVDAVTLANNHALDFGEVGLLDTLEHLRAAGIAWAGAGPDIESARSPAVLHVGEARVAVLGVGDHPPEYAAGADRAGIAFADIRGGHVAGWLSEGVRRARGQADIVLVAPHWGPNMSVEPERDVRSAAAELVGAGATLVAGHSAHVFHGVAGPVLYDLGDFLDDYAVDPLLRNDLGLLFLVELDASGPRRIEAVPLALDYCHTRLADREEAAWIARRFRAACEAFGTAVGERGGRLVIDYAI